MSIQVDSQIRQFRELMHKYSEHTAIAWLRVVLAEAQCESEERKRLECRNAELWDQLMETRAENVRLREGGES